MMKDKEKLTTERAIKFENVIRKNIVKGIESKKVIDRLEEEHKYLIVHYGGIRKYLLSMGDFKK